MRNWRNPARRGLIFWRNSHGIGKRKRHGPWSWVRAWLSYASESSSPERAAPFRAWPYLFAWESGGKSDPAANGSRGLLWMRWSISSGSHWKQIFSAGRPMPFRLTQYKMPSLPLHLDVCFAGPRFSPRLRSLCGWLSGKWPILCCLQAKGCIPPSSKNWAIVFCTQIWSPPSQPY